MDPVASYTTYCNHDQNLMSRVKARIQQIKGQEFGMSDCQYSQRTKLIQAIIDTYAVYRITRKIAVEGHSQRSNFRRGQKSGIIFNIGCNQLIAARSSYKCLYPLG